MKYICGNCGAELKEDASFCVKCGGCIIRHIGTIGFSVDTDGAYKTLDVAFISQKELDIANMLVKNVPELTIEHRTSDYTSLTYKDVNVCRVDSTEKGIYLYIIMTKANKKEYMDSPLFISQSNKNQVLWKTKYDESNLEIYLKLIKDGIKQLEG